jgi:cell division protein FtsQ
MVLPRPLRRVVRFLVSLGSGRFYIPAHTGTVSALAFLAATGFYGMSLGGHTEVVAQATTAAAGFAIEDVKVSGNSETSEIDILQLIGLDGTTSLVALDIDAARQKIAAASLGRERRGPQGLSEDDRGEAQGASGLCDLAARQPSFR